MEYNRPYFDCPGSRFKLLYISFICLKSCQVSSPYKTTLTNASCHPKWGPDDLVSIPALDGTVEFNKFLCFNLLDIDRKNALLRPFRRLKLPSLVPNPK